MLSPAVTHDAGQSFRHSLLKRRLLDFPDSGQCLRIAQPGRHPVLPIPPLFAIEFQGAVSRLSSRRLVADGGLNPGSEAQTRPP